MTGPANATFTVTMTPEDAELPGAGRFAFTKTWTGDLEGAGRGFMVSAGDPAAGAAGYLAQEVFEGTVNGRRGSLILHQWGTLLAGEASQRYEIAPGSGTGGLAGIRGSIDLEVVDGEHRVTLDYTLD